MSEPLWTTDAMAAAMGARRAGTLPEGIAGLSIDSRTLAAGEAFFAIAGDARDGHDFVPAALKAGAGVAVVAAEQAGDMPDGAPLLVLRLDTPGGLDSAMRQIIDRMLNCRTPVAAFVGPSGARADSAGFLITIAADVAAMAPGTSTGAAHPVAGIGGAMDETMSKKITQATAAYIRSKAARRGRNVELAELAVNESRAFTESEALGVTRNPWDPDRTPGGSSGGAAAAVAAGMAPIAHAADGGGSIRVPAACTGLVGLKPTRGRVTNALVEVEGMATQGVVARSVADAAAALDVLARHDPAAWWSPPMTTARSAGTGWRTDSSSSRSSRCPTARTGWPGPPRASMPRAPGRGACCAGM